MSLGRFSALIRSIDAYWTIVAPLMESDGIDSHHENPTHSWLREHDLPHCSTHYGSATRRRSESSGLTISDLNLTMHTTTGRPITSTLIEAVGQLPQDLDLLIEKHDIGKLAVALTYTIPYVEGGMTERLAAHELGLNLRSGLRYFRHSTR